MPKKMLNSFTVPKQVDHASCWAATASAVANSQRGQGAFPQDKLIKRFKARRSETGGMKPEIVLNEIGITTSKIKVGDIERDKLIAVITDKIDNNNPVIAGIKVEAGTLYWRPIGAEQRENMAMLRELGQKVPEPKTGPFTMGHAVVICGYDDTARQIFFMDPARGDGVARAVGYDELFTGFLYMQLSELGPNTRSKLSRTAEGTDDPATIEQGALNMRLDRVILV